MSHLLPVRVPFFAVLHKSSEKVSRKSFGPPIVRGGTQKQTLVLNCLIGAQNNDITVATELHKAQAQLGKVSFSRASKVRRGDLPGFRISHLMKSDCSACVCVRVHARERHLVNLRGALSEHSADGGGEAQLHQALQVSLGVCLCLVSGLFQSAAVNQGKTSAAAAASV